jgi:hypothetical protein
MLDGFIDALLQSFENCRAGLTDETLRTAGPGVSAFFLALYEKERPRLRQIVEVHEMALSDPAREKLFTGVDDLVRGVVIPAYVRLAGRFTPRERNDFFLAHEGLHGLERAGWAAAGLLLGAFLVWAPFVPIWEKEWVLVFAGLGLVFPNVRRFFALRRYQRELNRLVTRTDDEIWRMDMDFMTRGTVLGGAAPAVEVPSVEAEAGLPPGREPLGNAPRPIERGKQKVG